MKTINYVIYNGELYHYGVLGMKWGVKRAQRKEAANERLLKKAYAYDKRTANFTKKAEKAHSKYDLETANKAAVKAAKFDKKAANIYKRSLSSDDAYKRLSMEKKAENLKYKATKMRLKGNRISKSTGYGIKAMRYSVKSDKAAIKAAKARAKIASNKAYIELMNRKINSLSPEKLRKVEQPISEMLSESIRSMVKSNG